jgi:hypothetical protein
MPSDSSPRFRRPAPLFPARAEEIPGAPDPQLATDLGHESARALLDGVYGSTDPQVVHRVLHLVETEGLDDLASLWSGSPATTLPGALWRLYVLHTWVQRNGEDVVRRYREGSRTVPGLRYLAGVAEPPDIDQVRSTMDQILRGAFTGDLPIALGRAGAVAVLCAHGSAHLADREDDHEQQQAATRQAARLLSTGEELAAAARLAEEGALT